MSDFYRKNNNESTKDLYQKSVVYKVRIADPNYTNLKDFQFAEKYLYGRVNRRFVPMEIDINSAKLKGLPSTNKNDANTFQALNFVADAFNDLCMQFRKKVMAGQIWDKDPFLTTLSVNKAYSSPRTLYRYFSQGNKRTIADLFASRQLHFRNFDEFLIHLEPVLAEIIDNGPLTYPSFVKSRLCPMEVSGLVIDIASQSASNDEDKIKKFRDSPNWEFFLNACRSYGFSVDQNVPWRLIADIGSPEMIRYARKYSLLSTDAVIGQLYVGAHRTYYGNFSNILLEMYDACRRDFVEVEYCLDGTTRTHVVKPKQYTLAELKKDMGQLKFLEIYMKVRLSEEKEIALTENEKIHLTRECLEMHTTIPMPSIVDIFERLVGATYGSSGSLTDRLERVKVQEQERIDVLSDT